MSMCPRGGIWVELSPQDLEVVVTPLDKTALTTREEFREYVADDEDVAGTGSICTRWRPDRIRA